MSQFWTNEKGFISRVDTSGNLSQSLPKNTGRISDGHNIRLDGSTWDTTFEQHFDRPDSQFPSVIKWLSLMAENHPKSGSNQADGIHHAQVCGEPELRSLSECIISLVIRSPKYRNSVMQSAEAFRSNIPKEERKPLIAANLYQASSFISGDTLFDGKFVLLLSDTIEFIFGDGFYNNLSFNTQCMVNGRILLPLTPHLAILWTLPMECVQEPRFCTRIADKDLVNLVNESVQIYSKECLFFRDEQPVLSDYFQKREHLIYAEGDPIRRLVGDIPGVVTPRPVIIRHP